ncbi:hypothetical protein OUZ56_027035 [Daphnia magna]|uniref:Uncharacterized protein n=1 Tax=Daphnia magna TaxID=35525 RepID=A0ABQ9ZNJ9_9CRUS|nr:hypothetical protein OUZ56_027035 [Daphnia magna]
MVPAADIVAQIGLTAGESNSLESSRIFCSPQRIHTHTAARAVLAGQQAFDFGLASATSLFSRPMMTY